jgi:hypothetical protein
VLPVTLSPPWTFWMLIRYIMLSIAAIMIIGNFALESPVWGYEKEIVSTWRRAFPVISVDPSNKQLVQAAYCVLLPAQDASVHSK